MSALDSMPWGRGWTKHPNGLRELMPALGPTAYFVLGYLMSRANHEEATVTLRGGRAITLARNELLCSQREIADDLGLTRKQVRGAIEKLENLGFGAHRRAHGGAQSPTVISLAILDECDRRFAKEGPQKGPQKGPPRGPPRGPGEELEEQNDSPRPALVCQTGDRVKSKKPPSEEALHLAQHLRDQLISEQPEHRLGIESHWKAARDKWARELDRMHRIDRRDWKRSKELIDFVFHGQTGDFRFRVESAKSLREKWDPLNRKAKAASPSRKDEDIYAGMKVYE